MKNLIIVGAGGLGREVLQMCMEINKDENRWNIKGFIDDNLDALNGLECKYSVIGTIKNWQPAADEVFVLAIANPKIKKLVVEGLIAKGAKFETVISPRAFVADNAKIGKGVVVSPFCFVSDNTVLRDFVYLNVSTSIGHDTVIGEYSSLMSHVDVTGCCKVGNGTYWGSSSVALPSSKIGDNAVVAAGSLVLNFVRKDTKVFGVPAKEYEM